MYNKWHKLPYDRRGFTDYPEADRKILIDTNHGKYVALSKGEGSIHFLQSIHFNGPLTVPDVIVSKWKYITDQEYIERLGYIPDDYMVIFNEDGTEKYIKKI